MKISNIFKIKKNKFRCSVCGSKDISKEVILSVRVSNNESKKSFTNTIYNCTCKKCANNFEKKIRKCS